MTSPKFTRRQLEIISDLISWSLEQLHEDNLTSSGFKVRNQINYIDTPELEELEDIFNEYFVTQIKT